MKIIKSSNSLSAWRKAISKSVGFVPTMGALHEGHLSLIKASKKICNKTVVSIFINPTQFAPNEDLSSYPKTLELDMKGLRNLSVDVLFLPSEEEMYKKVADIEVRPSGLFNKLEGVSRPHFFYGVSTIVSKLFNVVSPTHTFFGEKDAQQLRVIKQLILNEGYNIKLVPCPTIRNKAGLALSSRNQYLSKEERDYASNIYQGLLLIKHALKSGERRPIILKELFKAHIDNFSSFALDYVSVACSETLNELEEITSKELLVSCAIYYNEVRLIDNFTYQPST